MTFKKQVAMSEEQQAENGSSGEVPEIELIIKVSLRLNSISFYFSHHNCLALEVLFVIMDIRG